ncbi:hypothetical protein FDECE_13405 [Fusarium decemcellulare]|nr:hypothetical protein FDECE_13405 [Fusarium decemcellulare]
MKVAALAGLYAALALALPQSDAASGHLDKRADFPLPPSQGTVTYPSPHPVKGVFDGELKTYGRRLSCEAQPDVGPSDAVFVLEDGATLKNAIIGHDQVYGVYCKGSCTIENVWWKNVCENALTLQGDGNILVTGGGATSAPDKVIEHVGLGTVTIDGFTAVDFGQLYRSCSNCKKTGTRNVVVKNVKAYDGRLLTGINPNRGDVSTITGTCASSVKDICTEYEGTTPGNEAKKLRSGPSESCKYSSVGSC